MRIAFLRHGPTDWNEAGRIQGQTDIGLSAAGKAKMAALGLPRAIAYARVYASPLLRARQTAALLNLPDPILDPRLMEQNWGRWEGLTRAQILARDGENAFARAGLGAHFHPPGGESTAQLLRRLAGFLRDAAQGEGDAVAVAHLGVLRAAYTLATGWAMDAPMPPDLDVSRILLLALDGAGTPSLAGLNLDFSANRA